MAVAPEGEVGPVRWDDLAAWSSFLFVLPRGRGATGSGSTWSRAEVGTKFVCGLGHQTQ